MDLGAYLQNHILKIILMLFQFQEKNYKFKSKLKIYIHTVVIYLIKKLQKKYTKISKKFKKIDFIISCVGEQFQKINDRNKEIDK